MIFAGIAAGGTGSRMGADIPKQFIELKGRPIIIRTAEKFLSQSRIEKIYLGVHNDWVGHTQELIERYIAAKERICVIKGGADRNSTVLKIINRITEDYGADDDDIILTHDAVRPFVTDKIINDNIEAALSGKPCTTAVKATDTILYSENGTEIESTLRRSCLYHAQTPQSFNIQAFVNAYSGLTDEQKASLTDACGVFNGAGIPVSIIEGDLSNIKITTPYDLKIAGALL
ncbi:2-C-methyl-D-erythritol 4-phosphate cytidylyltransferase [Ruminococcus sp. Marseille-P6503]|uniref:IspD/TarI family cytidylyltransferase n=1 Tax=Ruminococcus sp. Marseille-P6503 TaxID=2364796 RepID=UPI000F526E91|nr:2-C-methyl-D-erythritol 4-phosphate cytidylyltransferase [Ruminococcus sp. Marseille-P6503]